MGELLAKVDVPWIFVPVVVIVGLVVWVAVKAFRERRTDYNANDNVIWRDDDMGGFA